MAAVSGVARPNFEAINRVLAEIGKSIDPGSQQGIAVSDGEAQKIVDHLGKMQPADRKLVEAEIIALLQNDVFQATPEGRKKFAESFGLAARDLEPREAAELVGLASSRSAFQMGVELLAKTPRLDRKTMKLLTQRADTLLDVPNRQFLAGVIRNASRDGTVKLDTDARKLFREWMGGLDQKGGVSDWTTNLDTKGAGNVDYLSQLIASGACFEDILAAFMIHIAGQMQQEQTDKLREIQQAEQDAAKQPATVKSRMNDFMQENGLATDATDAKGSEAKGADAKGAAPEGVDPSYMKSTKRHLDALVQSVHYHMNDDDKYINADEAGKIAEKLERLEPPVSKLIAGSLVSSLRRTPGVFLEGQTFKPIVDWAKTQLGEGIDLSPLPRINASDPSDPFAQKLRQSDKLEDKIASFMVDSLLASEKDLGAKLGDLKQLSTSMAQYPEAAQAYQQVAPQPGDAAEKILAQADAAVAASAKGSAPETQAGPEAYGAQAQATPEAAPAGAAGALSAAAAADPAAAGVAPGAAGAAEAAPPMKSRQVLFEELKNQNNELAAVMQAISNILNSMHQNAMNSIRSIR